MLNIEKVNLYDHYGLENYLNGRVISLASIFPLAGRSAPAVCDLRS